VEKIKKERKFLKKIRRKIVFISLPLSGIYILQKKAKKNMILFVRTNAKRTDLPKIDKTEPIYVCERRTEKNEKKLLFFFLVRTTQKCFFLYILFSSIYYILLLLRMLRV